MLNFGIFHPISTYPRFSPPDILLVLLPILPIRFILGIRSTNQKNFACFSPGVPRLHLFSCRPEGRLASRHAFAIFVDVPHLCQQGSTPHLCTVNMSGQRELWRAVVSTHSAYSTHKDHTHVRRNAVSPVVHCTLPSRRSSGYQRVSEIVYVYVILLVSRTTYSPSAKIRLSRTGSKGESHVTTSRGQQHPSQKRKFWDKSAQDEKPFSTHTYSTAPLTTSQVKQQLQAQIITIIQPLRNRDSLTSPLELPSIIGDAL